MKNLVIKIYRNIFRLFSNKIGSDKLTSEAAPLSFTSFIVSILMFVLIVLILKLFSTKNYFFVANQIFIFLIYLIVEFRIKKAVEKD